MSAANQKLLSIAVTALSADAQSGEPVNELRIIEAVERYAPLAAPELDLEGRQLVIDELTKRFNVWTGRAGTLVGDDHGHQDWLPMRRDKITWRFWDRYRQYLEARIPPLVVTELHETTEEILSLLEDPERAGSWRRQGLVVGHVQSGKTGNYTGLICKAADAGFKVVVVLSGIHNSLRAQTQIRLDEGFLGYARPFGSHDARRQATGVGMLDPTPVADSVTTRDEHGDFSKAKAQGFQIHAGGNVLLFVVKKNVRVLKNLIEWAKLSAKKPTADGRLVVGEAPLLVIDDEADQASVDTHEQAFDEHGQPDPDHDPTQINHSIRILLETFERRAYVGYTATPFANVFVHPRGRTPEGGEDLFPRHFIINLSTPSDYFGPLAVFGREDDDLPDAGSIPSRLRFIEDADEWAPPSHKSSLVPRYAGTDALPPSLDAAIRSFILASAARRARGQVTEHKSMLVHVTRFTDVQLVVHQQVKRVVDDLRTRWRSRKTSKADPLAREMRAMWESDFAPTTLAHAASTMVWALVEPHVWPILDAVRVNLINAKATDALIYEEHKKTGLHVIAIGGDKLSRGLTLEGLTVSYFLRSSRMYDTLMQMGRWFGYRPGYEDLCRLYLSEELEEWYGHITEAADELRQEFDRMVLLGGTPEDYGLRVREHDVLAITGKLRRGLPIIHTSLSATPFEPTVFYETPDRLLYNWTKTHSLIEALGRPSAAPVIPDDTGVTAKRGKWKGSVLWSNVPVALVRQYLSQFAFADKNLTRTPSSTVVKYIDGRIAASELTLWTVVVRGASEEEAERDSFPIAVAGHPVRTLIRNRLRRRDDGLFVVRRIGSARDEAIDLSSKEWAEVVALKARRTPDPQRRGEASDGRLIREQRPKERGLMILYLLTPPREEFSPSRDVTVPFVAPYVSFPHSPTAKAVSYRLTHLYWEQELGGVE